MASKRKYNPNKLNRGKAMQMHDLWMTYDNDLVDSITSRWVESNPGLGVPAAMLYPHIQGDLIIAIKHRLISMTQKWHIRMSFDLTDGTTASVDFDLPTSELKDIKNDKSKIKIDRGGGILTRWEGLDKEVSKAIKPIEDEGVGIIKKTAHIRTTAKFKSAIAYDLFVHEKMMRMATGAAG